MTTPPILPRLPGLTWSRHKKPGFATMVAKHSSGREVRAAKMAYPLYEFDCSYSALPSANMYPGALGPRDQQTLLGFFLQMQGQFGTFLYVDPDDNSSAQQNLGTGDGATTSFLCMRMLGGFAEPVGWVTQLFNVRLNGAVQAKSAYGLAAPNSVAFVSAPASGAVITADFSYAYVCRFLDDSMDFEEFMKSLWKASIKFRSVKSWLG